MVAVGGGAFCDLKMSYCMLRFGFILVCCRYLIVICSYMSLNIVPVGFHVFPMGLDHHQPPSLWWQVVVVEAMVPYCCLIARYWVETIMSIAIYMLAVSLCDGTVFPAKQPLPVTATMVAGGGDLTLHA